MLAAGTLVVVASAAVWARVEDGAREPAAVDFANEVRPLLSNRCFQCHGPDKGARESDLRLDLRANVTEDRGGYAVVVPGEAAMSELIYRITAADAEELMPPLGSNLRLSAEEIALLSRWIDAPPRIESIPHTPDPVPEIVSLLGRCR